MISHHILPVHGKQQERNISCWICTFQSSQPGRPHILPSHPGGDLCLLNARKLLPCIQHVVTLKQDTKMHRGILQTAMGLLLVFVSSHTCYAERNSDASIILFCSYRARCWLFHVIFVLPILMKNQLLGPLCLKHSEMCRATIA